VGLNTPVEFQASGQMRLGHFTALKYRGEKSVRLSDPGEGLCPPPWGCKKRVWGGGVTQPRGGGELSQR